MAKTNVTQTGAGEYYLSVEIDPASLANLNRVLMRFRDVLTKDATVIIEDSMGQAVEVVRAEVAQRTPVGATGHLRNSLGTEVRVMESGVETDVTGSVYVGEVEYAIPVEVGTRPHVPPLEPLVYWVQRKLGIGDADEARSVASRIRWAIAKRGTKGQHYFGEGVDASLAAIDRIFTKGINRIERLFGGIS